MFRIIGTMMSFFFALNSFSGAPLGDRTTERIGKINELAQNLSKEYSFTIEQGGKEIPYTQRVSLNNCYLKLETLNDSAVVQRDLYDLTKKKVYKKVFPFKGTYVIDFGLNTILLGRSTLHFATKDELEETLPLFEDYVKLCHKSDVKKYYEPLRETEVLKPVEFFGGIPRGNTHEAGSVYGEEAGNSMVLLRGPDSFRERYKAILNARKSIYLSQLFFRGDPVGLLFADQLVKKRMEGLDVRVMVTGMFNIVANGDFKVDMENSVIAMRNLMAAGVRVHGVNCVGVLANSVRGIDIFKILTPSHIKNWLIDSDDYKSDTAISISGGMNVSARYFRLGNRLQWIDQDIGTRGPILSEMKERFMADFYERELHYRTVESDKKCLNTFDPITQKEDYLKFKEAHTKPYKSPTKEEEVSEWNYIKEQYSHYIQGLSRDGGQTVEPLNWVKVQGARYAMGRPSEKEDYLLKAHVDLVNSAKSEIIIANVFSLFVDDMKLALRRAAARGVKIRFLTNDPVLYKDLPFVNIMGRFYYRDLVYGDHKGLDEELDPSLKIDPNLVEIYEWKGAQGISPVGKDTVMHNKYMIIDRKVGLVGSFNMDYASLRNPEQIVIFENEKLANELAQFFDGDHKFAKKLTLEEINSFEKPKGQRFMLFIAKLLQNRL
ncbi:MAG: phosphatidylserine/phosphatidylglycerophosphate/cardiolipin synthase family protein [Bacteriovoracales bacterium]